MELTVHTFRADCTGKEAALKPLEEAAEAYAAWQDLQVARIGACLAALGDLEDLEDEVLEGLADEIADCVTACANLAERYGLDLQAALDRVEAYNRNRGRYD